MRAFFLLAGIAAALAQAPVCPPSTKNCYFTYSSTNCADGEWSRIIPNWAEFKSIMRLPYNVFFDPNTEKPLIEVDITDTSAFEATALTKTSGTGANSWYTAKFAGVRVTQPRANFNGGSYNNYVWSPKGDKKCVFVYHNSKCT